MYTNTKILIIDHGSRSNITHSEVIIEGEADEREAVSAQFEGTHLFAKKQRREDDQNSIARRSQHLERHRASELDDPRTGEVH